MKGLRHILLGIVIGFLLVLTMGFYDTQRFTDNTIHYWGTDNDASWKWDNATSMVDLIVAGGFDIDLTTKMTIDFSAAEDGSGGLKVTTNVPTGDALYGSIYGEAHIEGTTDSTVTAIRGKVSFDAASIPVGYMQGARITVEENAGADLTDARIAVLLLESKLIADGNDPAAVYMMRFNANEGAEAPDAWFQAANPGAVAFVPGDGVTGAKVGAIKCVIVGYDDCYIRIYDSGN